jgi:hypothetical protein
MTVLIVLQGGSGWEGSRRGAEHGQTCTKDHTGDVTVRAALESGVQLGRNDGVTMPAEFKHWHQVHAIRGVAGVHTSCASSCIQPMP